MISQMAHFPLLSERHPMAFLALGRLYQAIEYVGVALIASSLEGREDARSDRKSSVERDKRGRAASGRIRAGVREGVK